MPPAEQPTQRRALEKLSQSAARLAARADVEGAARELLLTAAELLGIEDAALYVPQDAEGRVWERLQASGSPCPGTMALPEESLEGRLEPCAGETLLAQALDPANGEPLRDRFEPFLPGLVAPLAVGKKVEGLLLLGPAAKTGAPDVLAMMIRQGAMALHSARLASELKDLREELDRKVLQLLTLFEVGREIHSFANWDLLTKSTLYTAMGNLGIRQGALLAPQSPGAPWRIWHSRGMPPGSPEEGFRLGPGDPLLGHLAEVRRAVGRRAVEASLPHNRILKLSFEVLLPGISSRAVEFALLLGDKLNGKPLSADELEYLMILCGQAAVVFENQELVRRSIERERLAAVGQALAGLSHDFRGILHGFSGASRHLGRLVERLRDGQTIDTAQMEKWWKLLCSNEKRLTDLVQDILEYSRPREPLRETCQLNELLQELVRQRREELERRKIRLELDLARSLPPLKADPTRLFRAIANLLDNACDAVSAGSGRIELRTRMQPDAVTLEVKDNGVGIAAEHLPRLFDPLFTTKKGSEGTGFGLANVKKIVEEHRGRIRVSSQPGAGSVFRLELPLEEDSRRLEAAARQTPGGEEV